MKKIKAVDEKALLEKNPEAAKILLKNRAKMGKRPFGTQKEYDLGLPYERPLPTLSTEDA